jgi:hypothetical protein
MKGEYLSVEININGDDMGTDWTFRSIQVPGEDQYDENIKKKLMRDIHKLIDKYEKLGCHIGR